MFISIPNESYWKSDINKTEDIISKDGGTTGKR